MTQGAKTWVMTWNNWTEEDHSILTGWLKTHATKAVVGKEIAPTTGTPHLQGAFTLKKTTRLAGLQKALGKGIFFQIAVTKDPFTYCGKTDKEPWTWDCTEPGKRKDLDDLYEDLKAGAGWDKIFTKKPCYQHIGIAEKYKKYIQVKRPHGPREVLWFSGPSGTGKSRTAYDLDPDLLAIQVKRGGTVWFDGYVDQKTVLFDDLRPDSICFDKLLRLTDRYTIQEEVKCGHVWANYDRIIITSILRPQDWPTDGTGLEQLLRRITDHREFAAA